MSQGLDFISGKAGASVTGLPDWTLDPAVTSDRQGGTLLLWDCQKSFDALASIPANGAQVRNLMAAQAAALTGGAEADQHAYVEKVITAGADVSLALGRSAKGGLVVAPSQLHHVLGDHCVIRPSASQQQWLFDHIPGATVFLTMWCTLLRAQVPVTQAMSPLHISSLPSGLTNVVMHSGNLTPQQAAKSSVYPSAPVAVGVPALLQMSASVWRGVKPLVANQRVALGGAGCFDAWNSFNQNKSPALVIYRVQAEVLSVSGRTHEEVAALNQDYFNTCFGEGGRFAGDNWASLITNLIP